MVKRRQPSRRLEEIRTKARKARQDVADLKKRLAKATKEGKVAAAANAKAKAKAVAAASSSISSASMQRRSESLLHKFPLCKVPVPGPRERSDALQSPDLADPALYLQVILKEMVHRLSITQKHALWVALKRFGLLVVGTVCSGTECPILVLRALAAAADAILPPLFGPVGFSADHLFSTEIDDDKRHFIEQVMKTCSIKKLYRAGHEDQEFL